MFQVYGIMIWLTVWPLEPVSPTGESRSHSLKQHHPSWAEDPRVRNVSMALTLRQTTETRVRFSVYTESLQWNPTNPAPSLAHHPPRPQSVLAMQLPCHSNSHSSPDRRCDACAQVSTLPTCQGPPSSPIRPPTPLGRQGIAPTSCWWHETLSSHLGKTLWDRKAEPPCAITYSS